MVINIDKLRKLQKVLEEFEDILNNIEILRQACEIGLINEEYKKVVTFLEEFRENHRDASQLKYVSHECNASQRLDELHSPNASHWMGEPHKLDASQRSIEPPGGCASQKVYETHLGNASHAPAESQPKDAKPQPTAIIYPKTNPKCEIHVFKQNDEIKLEWHHANRKVDEIVIKNEWEVYRIMREHAIGNILTFSRFWNLVKNINGFNSVKASMIFNYIGSQKKFNTEIKKVATEILGKTIKEWAIEFKSWLDEGSKKDIKEKIKEERKLWQDLLG